MRKSNQNINGFHSFLFKVVLFLKVFWFASFLYLKLNVCKYLSGWYYLFRKMARIVLHIVSLYSKCLWMILLKSNIHDITLSTKFSSALRWKKISGREFADASKVSRIKWSRLEEEGWDDDVCTKHKYF